MKTCAICLLLFVILGVVVAPIVSAQDEEELVPVIIALESLPRGLVLTDENVLGENPVVALVFYPADSLPATAIQSLNDLIGRVVRTNIEVENPIAEHYLFPHPHLAPNVPVPFPISPEGYYVVRDYGTYVEYALDDLDRLLYPVRLAAGDRVDIIGTTGLGDITQDETRILVENLVIARMSEAQITLSLTPPERAQLSAVWEAGFSLTLVIRSQFDSQENHPPANIITWQTLTERDLNPLLIPEGADLSQLELDREN